MKTGAFADLTGISAYTLRYYEKEGLLQVCRDQYDCRVYAEADVEWIKFLQKLKATGRLLRDIRKYACLRYEGEAKIGIRLELLTAYQGFMDEKIKKWQQYSTNLEDKIAVYRQLLKQQSQRPDT